MVKNKVMKLLQDSYKRKKKPLPMAMNNINGNINIIRISTATTMIE